MTGDVTLREDAEPADRDRVADILRSTGFFREPEIEIAVELVSARLGAGPDAGYHFIFAESNGETVGYTCFGPIPCTRSSFDLYWIAVHRDAQGQGLGRLLMQTTEQRVSRLGGTRLYIDTSSSSRYEPTRRFYERRGFQRAAFLPDFYGPGDAKVVYCKVL